MESLLKVEESIIYTRLKASVRPLDVLHDFRAGRGTGTEILELNMVQELAIVEQDTLLLVFLDLWNAYNTVDRGLPPEMLEEDGTGPQMCRLLEVFWDQKEAVTCQNRYHGLNFRANRGINQGGIISPTLFNLIVENAVMK